MNFSEQDQIFMQRALDLAKQAELQGEVPVGCVITDGENIIAEGWNQPISLHDPSAHAEMLAIRAAAQIKQNYRLPNLTLYVTLEPCVMCAGTIMQARIARVVYGALEPKTGAAISQYDILTAPKLNHYLVCEGGLFADESRALLQNFFKNKRILQKNKK